VAIDHHAAWGIRLELPASTGHNPGREQGVASLELLERAQFLATLAEYADEAKQGDGRMVLVSGESGIGKTVLMEAFQARLTGARWLWGSCDGLLTPRPLGPLLDIAAHAGGEFAELCRNDASRERLFAAFTTELASPGALPVMVMEDVHWADEATIDLLSFVGRRLARIRALVLVTYRDDELGDDHRLRIVLGDLATQRATRRMGLPPLSPEAVRLLVGQREVDAAEVHRVTGGNPFYVSEILDSGSSAVPATVRDAVGARLGRASPAGRRVIELAAVIGARVDRSLIIPALGDAASSLDDGLASGILVPDGTDLRFRHEIVRRAVEAGIAPHRKLELHTYLLNFLEERGGCDPAVLAHHAEGAADATAVLQHAPEAARQSSALGAHREAAAQFERALRFADDADDAVLAALYEGAAAEYAPLDRWDDTETALRAALRLRRELGDFIAVGDDLRLLSVTLWRLCRGQESSAAAEEAVHVLEPLPAGPELAWAYANLGARMWSIGHEAEGRKLLAQAQEIGERLERPGIVSYTLNALGLALSKRRGQDGIGILERALQIGLDANMPEAVGRALSSLGEAAVSLQRFEEAGRYYDDGMAYCEGRELGAFSLCLMGWRTRGLVQLGRWDEAVSIGQQMLHTPRISQVNQLNPLQVIGTIRGRRAQAGAWDLLNKAEAFGVATAEPQWIVPVRAARAELRWLSGDRELAIWEAESGFDQGLGRVDPWVLGSAAVWLARLNAPASLVQLAEPYALEIAGDYHGAALAWEQLGRTYDAALTRLFSPDEAEMRRALAVFEDLGAKSAADAARRRMKELGITAIPRGPRLATRDTPAGLTMREQEVLVLIAEGLADREISARLFISERTVNHHVSSLLNKIGVANRAAAAREASRLGLLSIT